MYIVENMNSSSINIVKIYMNNYYKLLNLNSNKRLQR